MATEFCCGAECGVDGAHMTLSGTGSFSTTTVRNGARSFRVNPSAASGGGWSTPTLTSGNIWVIRFAVQFATLPSVDQFICLGLASSPAVGFNASDSKLYPAYSTGGTPTFGSQGVSVTTGVWYVVNAKFDISTNPWTIDLTVDNTSVTQLTKAVAGAAESTFRFGVARGVSTTADVFIDDILITTAAADYPIGDGYVNHFIPTSDGTHNVAGANDFERSATGTDITNSTTDAYQLIDDVPLKSGSVTEYINLIAPPNATDYVEVKFGPAAGISTPTVAPRAVEAIIAKAKGTGTGTNNLRIALNDNGSLDDIFNGDTTTASPTASYARKHYSDPPSAASVWTLSGNGNFNNVRMRCFTSDAAPDPWWASAMIEAEFATVSTFNTQKTNQNIITNISGKRASYF